MKKALITGITGQDGSYLAELLLEKGYVESFASIFNIMRVVKLDQCYHPAAISFVTPSVEDQFSTLITGIR